MTGNTVTQHNAHRLPVCYRIGRSKDHCDILVEDSHRTVSGLHLELLRTGRGRWYVRDRSRNGTFVFRNQRWERIKEGYVEPTEFLSLGRYQTTTEQLVKMAEEAGIQPQSMGRHADPDGDTTTHTTQVRMAFHRDPETGKVIFPRKEND